MVFTLIVLESVQLTLDLIALIHSGLSLSLVEYLKSAILIITYVFHFLEFFRIKKIGFNKFDFNLKGINFSSHCCR